MKHLRLFSKKAKLTTILFLCFTLSFAQTNLSIDNEILNHNAYNNYNITISGTSELHITGEESVLANSTINLTSEEAWLFFDNIKPSDVISTYLPQIQINGVAAAQNVNMRIRNYTWGTLIIPHTPDYQPLAVYSEASFSGESMMMSTFSFYRSEVISDDASIDFPVVTLDSFSDSISSFKLKRGYMATFAQESDGTGYSRVYVADREDIEISVMPNGLQDNVSFIRVLPWNYPSKKGMTYETGTQMLRGSWYYNWGSGKVSTNNTEYVPMKWGGGNVGTGFSNKNTATHILGFNEPSHSDQSNLTVDKAIKYWSSYQKSGLRIGSPGIADNGKSWLWEFMAKADELNLRIDFVAVHYYQGGKSAKQMYSWLKEIHTKTGRPVWVTEWNNGANWTNEGDPTFEEQAADIAKMIEMMDTTSWIERYAIYNWVENCRAVILKDTLTLAGEVYRDQNSPLAYNPDKDFHLPYLSLTKPYLLTATSTVSWIELSWSENVSGEVGVIIEKSENGLAFYALDSIEAQGVTSYTDKLAQESGAYKYRVRYYSSSSNSDYSNVATINARPSNLFNVTMAKTVTVDSYLNDSYSGQRAVDGNISDDASRWISANTAFPHWIEVDLKGTFNISWLSFYTGYGGYNKPIYDFELEYYDIENNTWATALSVKDNNNAQFHSAFEEVTTNKIRLKGTRALDNYFRLFEIEVYGSPAEPSPYENVALKKIATTSSAHSSNNYTGSKTVDGNNDYDNASRWVSDGASLPEWLEIDLKGAFIIDRIRLYIGTYSKEGPFKAFDFEYYNGNSWTKVLDIKDNTETFVEKAFEEVKATKVRLNVTGGGTTVRLHEIEVFGYEDETAGIDNNTINQSYQVFPNPARDALHIQGLEKAVEFQVYDMTGKKVLEGLTKDELRITSLQAGIYFIRINDHTSQKFVKE